VIKIIDLRLGISKSFSDLSRVMRETLNPNNMTTSEFLTRQRQVILDEITIQREMLSYWGHISETKKNIESKISELENSLKKLENNS
jgi:hypothetical protein